MNAYPYRYFLDDHYIYGYYYCKNGKDFFVDEAGEIHDIVGWADKFTGMFDIEGKPVYEGDILEIYDWLDNIDSIEGRKVTVAVVWDDDKTGFYPFTRCIGNNYRGFEDFKIIKSHWYGGKI